MSIMNRFTIVKPLTLGKSSAKVDIVANKRSGKQYVLKRFITLDSAAKNEIKVSKYLSQSRANHIFPKVHESGRNYLLLEYLKGYTSLNKQTLQRMSNTTRKAIMFQLVFDLTEHKDFTHSDLHLFNIMITSKYYDHKYRDARGLKYCFRAPKVKLIDFGWSHVRGQSSFSWQRTFHRLTSGIHITGVYSKTNRLGWRNVGTSALDVHDNHDMRALRVLDHTILRGNMPSNVHTPFELLYFSVPNYFACLQCAP